MASIYINSSLSSVSLADAQAEITREMPSNTERRYESKIEDLLKNYEKMKLLDDKWIKNHALHETLKGEGMIELYDVYRNKDPSIYEVIALIRFGKSLNGHPDIVHGGISALCIDNTFGWLFAARDGLKPGFTANLTVNYRRPILADSTVLLTAKFDNVAGRKMFMSAKIDDLEGNRLVDSTTLFIMPK